MKKAQRRGFTFVCPLRHASLNVQHVGLGRQATLDGVVYQRLHGFRRSGRQYSFTESLAGRTDQCRGSALAQTQTRAAKPGGASARARGTCGTKHTFQFGTKPFRAACDASNVVTDVGYNRGTGRERKHSIERRHTMNFRGGNVQAQRDIVDSAGTNPANAVLDRMQQGQKAMPLSKAFGVGNRAASRRMDARRLASSIRAHPDPNRRQRVPLQLLARRLDEGPISSSQIFSIRIAVALNSAVPDLGSTASMVSSLVAI